MIFQIASEIQGSDLLLKNECITFDKSLRGVNMLSVASLFIRGLYSVAQNMSECQETLSHIALRKSSSVFFT